MTDAGNGFIPLEILEGTTDYVKRIAWQANGCHKERWYDACAVMLRRLIEVLIEDSFEFKGAIGDIKEYQWKARGHTLSEEATGTEIGEFLRTDFKKLEHTLQAVARSVLRLGRPEQRSLTYIWQSLTEILPEPHDEVPNDAFYEVIETEKSARAIQPTIAGQDITSARKAIFQILVFLSQQYASAGVQPPSEGEFVSLAKLIKRYLAAPETYWTVEGSAKPGLGKIRKLGNRGAHGRYQKITETSLDNNQDDFIAGICQLAATAQEPPHAHG